MLSHPLIVEAAETLFTPVAIRNNTKGDAEAAIREAFEEPAWNNPVVRIVDPATRADRIPRIADDWSLDATADALVAARRAAEREVPAWLALLASEQLGRRGIDVAIFGMG
ncbi:MAG: hypothetical protein IPM29_22395 [Planctomycetes bacterium]|nr:hypothetical protein [Planctomycetota bacterium]